MRKILIVGSIGFATALREVLIKETKVAQKVIIQAPQERRIVEAYTVYPNKYPSVRKSKGDKKRAASHRRSKGWL